MGIHSEFSDRTVQCTVNGEDRTFSVTGTETLLKTLRGAGYYEVKNGCNQGVCGACNVIVDGDRVTRSCLTPTATLEGSDVMTVAGLTDESGDLHPLQEEFLAHGAAQCGFCIPGILLSSYQLLQENPDPTRDEIAEQLSGNICRCTGYAQQIEAIEAAADRLRDEAPKQGCD